MPALGNAPRHTQLRLAHVSSQGQCHSQGTSANDTIVETTNGRSHSTSLCKETVLGVRKSERRPRVLARSGRSEGNGGSEGKKVKKVRTRTPHQLHLSKLCQRRYRERQKQKLARVQAAVPVLQERCSRFEEARQQNAILKAAQSRLEAIVQNQHAFILALQGGSGQPGIQGQQASEANEVSSHGQTYIFDSSSQDAGNPNTSMGPASDLLPFPLEGTPICDNSLLLSNPPGPQPSASGADLEPSLLHRTAQATLPRRTPPPWALSLWGQPQGSSHPFEHHANAWGSAPNAYDSLLSPSLLGSPQHQGPPCELPVDSCSLPKLSPTMSDPGPSSTNPYALPDWDLGELEQPMGSSEDCVYGTQENLSSRGLPEPSSHGHDMVHDTDQDFLLSSLLKGPLVVPERLLCEATRPGHSAGESSGHVGTATPMGQPLKRGASMPSACGPTEASGEVGSLGSLTERLEEQVRAIHGVLAANAIVDGSSRASREVERELCDMVDCAIQVAVSIARLRAPKACASDGTFRPPALGDLGEVLVGKIRECAAMLHLTGSQKQDIGELKCRHVARLQQLYEERSMLNQQAKSVVRASGSRQLSAVSASVRPVWEQVKRNVKEERTEAAEALRCLAFGILRPLQAALLTAAAQSIDIMLVAACLEILSEDAAEGTDSGAART
ncbi:unnamed protein product [Ostreobium quekettii]|uniref:Uncharacterized protein n=1 Tax=Ostreobium quekettii TaxID=121088 RepID=A0A8S1J7T1_9CHLO|nr:unnamed protein product [Ostreobium quekettii]